MGIFTIIMVIVFGIAIMFILSFLYALVRMHPPDVNESNTERN